MKVQPLVWLPVVAALAGCYTFKSGGAPSPAADLAADIAAIEKQLGPAASIQAFYQNPSEESRNRFIAARLVSTNLRYIQFLRGITTERQALDTASDVAVMSLGLAGASFTPAGTKTVLAAASSAISGSRTAIDQHYFFEKTIPALIAAMNAQRAEILVTILEGRNKSLAEYSFEQAVVDLQQYYVAGTFFGALESIQTDSGERVAKSNAQIAELAPLPVAVIQKKRDMIAAINALKPEDLANAQAALAKTDSAAKPGATLDAVKSQLRAVVRDTHTDEAAVLRVEAILRETNILK